MKLNCSDALVQLAKVTVTEPTGGDAGAGFVGWSNTPPVVSWRVSGTVRVPGLKLPSAVNQRWPETPAPCPPGAYVYQVRNNARDCGFTSNTKPCPDVAASYQLPDSAKSAFVGGVPPETHVTFIVRRVRGIEPARPLPSVNA